MNKHFKQSWLLGGLATMFTLACNKANQLSDLETQNIATVLSNIKTNSNVSGATLNTIAITTAEVVSGFNFSPQSRLGAFESGNYADANNMVTYSDNAGLNYEVFHGKGGGSGKGGGKHDGGGIKSGLFSIDGISLLAANDTLLAITDFENINEHAKNFYGYAVGGATITHYDASGAVLTNIASLLPTPTLGCSQGKHRSGKHLGLYDALNIDSLLSTVAKTVIDFGTGVSVAYQGDTVTRSGQIVITRTGTYPNTVQAAEFVSYYVNGIGVSGNKTLTTTKTVTNDSIIYNSYNIVGTGKLTFSDNTTASLQVNKSKVVQGIINVTTKHFTSGTITTTANNSSVLENGTTLYSYVTTQNLVEDLSCTTRRKPKNGMIDINYLANVITINFAGTCGSTTLTVTINGVVYTRSI
ncbi:MAG: hypothetical protein QM539_03605 [Alphaproteobacteria bacterium]|nr:hypothetical protein [Alphaproteobacteria bacterium]